MEIFVLCPDSSLESLQKMGIPSIPVYTLGTRDPERAGAPGHAGGRGGFGPKPVGFQSLWPLQVTPGNDLRIGQLILSVVM